MNKLLSQKSNSNSSQSKHSDIDNSISPRNQEKNSDSQKIVIQNETPLSTKGNVKSYCRIRPNNTIFNCLGSKIEILNNNKTLSVDFTPDSERNNPLKQNKVLYNFTDIFGTSTSNKEIFEIVCRESIKQFFSKQKNALIFVYGITNSGKTYTISGNLNCGGILQHSLYFLGEEFEKLRSNNSLWQLTCTYVEIYNEEIYDLLSIERKKLKIGGSSNFYPKGAIVKNIEKRKDFNNILILGEQNRSKGETKSNPFSSRSHSIFRVELSYKGNVFQNKKIEPVSMCLVDLAGAERASKSGVNGSGIKETGNINTSLLCLRKCFNAMEANSKINCMEKKIIVPVRESKLTSLFQEYFAPHQNISIICTINPDKKEMNDIKRVLDFGSHAMKVKTVKSWIKINKDLNSIKTESRENSPFLKRYRMYTNKKYIAKHNINSNEKDRKIREDYDSNNSSFNSESSHKFKSSKKVQNIKIIKNKKYEERYCSPIIKNNNRNINDENSNNNSHIDEERKKCTTNPFQLLSTKNFRVKLSGSKESQNLVQKMEEKQLEIKEKISKKGVELKQAFSDYLKKMYFDNLIQNKEIYDNQCKNIDLYEIQTLLSKKNNNIYTLANPFVKSYEENKKIFSKNLKICVDNNILFPPQLDYTRTTNQVLGDLLDIKLDNEHDHDQTKIHEYLDRSLEQYQTTKFKAYFGIGESLIKKAENKINNKINNKTKDIIINKFNSLNNEIEMEDKVNNNENENKNENNEEIMDKEFNYKRKNKKEKKNNENSENQNIENNEKIAENIINKKNEDNKINDDEQSLSDENIETKKIKKNKKKKNQSKKRNKSKKQKTQPREEEEEESKDNKEEIKDNTKDEIDNSNNEDESSENLGKLYPKNKRNKKGGTKKSKVSYDSSDDSDNEKPLLAKKNKKKRKNKKKKIESDNEAEDDSLSDYIVNIKPSRGKKGKTKKRKY